MIIKEYNYNDIKYVMKCASNVSTQKDLDAVLGSLLSIDRNLYEHYSELANDTELSPAYIGKCISDDLYYMLKNSKVEVKESISSTTFRKMLKVVYDNLEELDDYIEANELTAEEDELLLKYGEMISYFANKYLKDFERFYK